MLTRVFVYGTLKPGHGNYQICCSDRITAAHPAMVHGRLFSLPLGYPAMIGGEDWVKGYLLSFNQATILNSLDDLEDYNEGRPTQENFYNRQWIEVFDLERQTLGHAWAYFMAPERVQSLQGSWLPQGEWLGC